MSRLIDADKVIEEINKAINSKDVNERNDFVFGVITGLESATYFIDEAPTVEERPQGKWVYESDTVNSLFRCSNCGRFYPHDIFVEENDDRYTRLEREDANRFCWHCGADMRGTKNDV